jgi:hypothetical protein
MTPTVPSDIIVEYRFRCFCGAPIVATEKALTCANCGASLGIRRFKRQHWKIAPRPLPHRRLQFADLHDLAIRILFFLSFAGCLYVLGNFLSDLVSS